MSKTSVLFVCMGNICRSPTAQGVFERLVEEAGLKALIEIDSAGTHAYHVGEPPDKRATEAAAERGIDLTRQRARRVCEEDFESFDFIHRHERIRLLLEFAESGKPGDVPDPYYGGAKGFERVLDMVEDGAKGLLDEVRQRVNVIRETAD